MRTLTLDTNVLRLVVEPDRAGHEEAKELLKLHETSKCEIRVTTRLDVDVPDGQLRAKIDSLDVSSSERIGTIFRLDHSKLDSGDFLSDKRTSRESSELMEQLFPGPKTNKRKQRTRLADIDHLMGHKKRGRDIFVTEEKGILCRRTELHCRFGITVMSLSEVLADINDPN